MIICRSCFHEIPSGHASCIFCGEDVVQETEVVDPEPQAWEIVRTVSTEMEARILAGRLIAHDVPACVLSQVDSTRGFTIGALAVAKVFVPVDRVEEARAILSDRGEELLDGDLPGEPGTEDEPEEDEGG